ncbi:MAG: glycosyl transferase [Comamonadaceae bacterium PBBC2]|nr:MAG: glycosyl transferase [Comamonadaceae bacterium PBBC2]
MAKIVHFGKYYLPDSGGIESVTVSVAKGAVAAGHAVTVVCFAKSLSVPTEVMDGVTVVRAPIAKLVASQPLGLKYFSKCLAIAREADIVHLHAPNMLGALCALFIKRRTRLLVHWHSDVINKGWLGYLTRPLEKAMLHRADCIVATSQVYADSSLSLQSFKHKTKVVPIGVADPVHVNSSSELPPELDKWIAGRRIVLAVGRLVPYKGFDVLLRAAAALTPDAVVVIVGSGPLQEELCKAAEASPEKGRIILAGRLSDAELQALFARASLYCLPSTYRAEAFGVVLLEAMAHGLPIVATEIPGSGVPWVNQHGVSGLNVPVKDAEQLAAACNQILSSSTLHQKFAVGARQRFLDVFTEDISVRNTLNSYAALLDR